MGFYMGEEELRPSNEKTENAPSGESFLEGVVKSLSSGSRSEVSMVKLKRMKHSH